MPAKTSSTGFIAARTRAGAYSLRKIALMSPMGTATTMAINATTRVPLTSGNTPNDFDANSGVQRVPVRKSTIGTSRKNASASPNSVKMMPAVVRIETAAHKNRTP